MEQANNVGKKYRTTLKRRVLAIMLAVMLVAGMIMVGTVFAADNITDKLEYTFKAYSDAYKDGKEPIPMGTTGHS